MNRRGFLTLVGGMLVTKPLSNLGFNLPKPRSGIADDFHVSYTDVRYVASGDATYYTVDDFYRSLCELSDKEAAELDAPHDITNRVPAVRLGEHYIELINGHNIDDHTAKHLTEGAIRQGDVVHCAMPLRFG